MATPESARRVLPRRDFVLLPLLSLLTVAAMFGLTEASVRLIAPEVRTDSCRIPAAAGATLFKTNCVSKTKILEGPWVLNQYNECGYRSRASCGAKPPGTIRIAVLGTSAATGFMVPYEQTVWGIVERRLTRECGRPVEVQNLALMGGGPSLAQDVQRIDQALALKPDLVVLMASGNDLIGLDEWHPEEAPAVGAMPARQSKLSIRSVLEELKVVAWHSATMTALRYFMYRDDERYLRIYVRTQGDGLGYLRVPYTADWRRRMGVYESLVANVAEKTAAQGVPFVVAPSIFRAQVLLLRSAGENAGVDPYAFDKERKTPGSILMHSTKKRRAWPTNTSS